MYMSAYRSFLCIFGVHMQLCNEFWIVPLHCIILPHKSLRCSSICCPAHEELLRVKMSSDVLALMCVCTNIQTFSVSASLTFSRCQATRTCCVWIHYVGNIETRIVRKFSYACSQMLAKVRRRNSRCKEVSWHLEILEGSLQHRC